MTLEIQIEKRLLDFSLEVSFTAHDRPLTILGPSGAGKSVLLRCLAGLENPGHGRITSGNRVLLDTERGIRLPARERRVGMLFQHYALFPHRTVAENIAFGLRHLSSAEQKRRVASLLERTHIAGLENRYPRDLSGGEQQRIALARALAIEPEALLLDEPLSALDTHLRSQMETLLQETFSAYERPVLLVTHNIEEAYRLGERLLVLSRGRIAALGWKEDIFRRPPTVEVARITGCQNFSRARPVSGNTIEALDWGLDVHVAHAAPQPAYIGVRAHDIKFLESSSAGTGAENVFPCWPVRSSEAPFRITVFLALRPPLAHSTEYHLQAEVSKERWQRFRGEPPPWHFELSPDSLFLLPE